MKSEGVARCSRMRVATVLLTRDNSLSSTMPTCCYFVPAYWRSVHLLAG